MTRVVRCGLVQARTALGPEAGLPAITKAMIERHAALITQSARPPYDGAALVRLPLRLS